MTVVIPKTFTAPTIKQLIQAMDESMNREVAVSSEAATSGEFETSGQRALRKLFGHTGHKRHRVERVHQHVNHY